MASTVKARSESSTDRVYEQLRQMAIEFELRPGERVNELELARRLNVSRTPLRHACNRLASEGFLRAANRGFYCRSLDVREIFDLYEFRCETEVIALRMSCQRASDKSLQAFAAFASGEGQKREGMSTRDLVHLDEQFHERIAEMAGNSELLRVIQNINARIRFVRCIDMERRIEDVSCEHNQLVKLLQERDHSGCEALMRKHVSQRQEQIIDVVRAAFAHIYVGPQLTT